MRITKKHFIWLAIATVVAIVSGEIFARYYLGLGTPPLTVTHPRIEYMFKPNQDVYRFGNHIIINQYGMRTEPFAVNAADQFRIMVFGDSVLNGGNQTDHAELATTILKNKLSNAMQQEVIVGNISAGSWGPANWLAYAKEYGFFRANIVVLVVSSHDYADNPTFQTLNENTHPTKRPASALSEVITRYLPRYLPQLTTGSPSETDRFAENTSEQEALKGLRDLKDFLALAKNSSTYVLVLQHWEKEEIERGSPKVGSQRIREVCESMGISHISLEPYFRQSIENGQNPYRDNIHPNQIGQQLIADAIFENLPNKTLQWTR